MAETKCCGDTDTKYSRDLALGDRRSSKSFLTVAPFFGSVSEHKRQTSGGAGNLTPHLRMSSSSGCIQGKRHESINSD